MILIVRVRPGPDRMDAASVRANLVCVLLVLVIFAV